MTPPQEFHYHCLVDPADGSIISQGETRLNGRSPNEVGNRLIERWGRAQLPSMKDREERTLDYYYATDLIRPHRAVATFTKGPFVAIRSVTGSRYPGHEEHYDYELGYDECQPARYNEFPLPESPPDYLAKKHFYDHDAVKQALESCIEDLKSAASLDFPPESATRILAKTEALVVSTGGHGLHPHPVPFFGTSDEEGAIMILDLVIFGILNGVIQGELPDDVIQAHKERRKHSTMQDHDFRQCLKLLKP